MKIRALFYIEQDYSYAILRPLQTEILAQGGVVNWFLVGKEVSRDLLADNECCLTTVDAVIEFCPEAVFVPGDRVPSFIPGLKVQVFHGLNEDKRGNVYPERGLFDLYCTEGPVRTGMLAPLSEQRPYFKVIETGWLKIDTLFAYDEGRVCNDNSDSRPTILYASTFTARLSGAEALYHEIKRLSQLKDWQWLITLHPKMASSTVALYRNLAASNVEFCGTDRVVELLHRADIMVCDNSSILQEFLLLNKPVVTFNNRAPLDCMIDINKPEQLEEAILCALDPSAELRKAIGGYGQSITPFLDGRSALRVLKVVKEMLVSDWRDKKPLNLWRNFKMRRQLNYFRFW